jgi:hypothetical protein
MADITGSIHERYVVPRRVKILASLLTCSSDAIELISSALLLRLKIENVAACKGCFNPLK